MTCPNCGGDEVVFPVLEAVREHLPDDRVGATICAHCLRVSPADEAPEDYPDFSTVSEAFPDDGETSAVLAVLLALLDRLVLHREDADRVATGPSAAAWTCCCSSTGSPPTSPSTRNSTSSGAAISSNN